MTRKNKINIIILVIALSICCFATIAIYTYRVLFTNNVRTGTDTYIYIPTNATYQQVLDSINTYNILQDTISFNLLAQKKNYPSHVHAGKYRIKHKMSNNDIINMLRSGNQDPIKLSFNNIRTKQQLALRISEQIECTYDDIFSILNNTDYWSKYGLTTENCMVLFIPNTYEFWWNTSAENFIERMYAEYTRFWNNSRNNMAQQIPLTPIEVSILAAIVEEENHLASEQPIIAGLYINRLHKNMPLQSDPTLKFALGDFEIKRLLNQDKEVNSPYNTYLHTGLTPGPIRIPSIQAIDAVLYYQKHNYLYMCAKEDFSGKHNFATSLAQHEHNAARYHAALNKKGIKR